MSSELILYRTENGSAQIKLRAVDGSILLSQIEITELFAIRKQNISLHVRNILKEGELAADSAVKDSLTTAADFDARRREAEALKVDVGDLKALEEMKKQVMSKGGEE